MDFFLKFWDFSFQLFLFLILIDYVTGILKSVYNKKVSSSIGLKGIIKKIGIVVCIITLKIVDQLNLVDVNVSGLVVLFFSVNEILSVLENLSEIGVNLPDSILSILKNVDIKNKK